VNGRDDTHGYFAGRAVALRLLRSFFLRCRSFFQRRIALDPRPMQRLYKLLGRGA
jgi:hypothetical protein